MVEDQAPDGLVSISPGSKPLLARRIDAGLLQPACVDGERRFSRFLQCEQGMRHIYQLAVMVSISQRLQYEWLYLGGSIQRSKIENLELHHKNIWKRKPFVEVLYEAVVIHVNASVPVAIY
jgi:hypothetical protein